jgi:hypothetical protein
MAAITKSLPQVTVTTAGTAVPLTATTVSNCIKAYISAPASNTGNVWIGDSSVKASTGVGMEIVKGTTRELVSPTGDLLDLQTTYADAATSGDKVSITYLVGV